MSDPDKKPELNRVQTGAWYAVCLFIVVFVFYVVRSKYDTSDPVVAGIAAIAALGCAIAARRAIRDHPKYGRSKDKNRAG